MMYKSFKEIKQSPVKTVLLTLIKSLILILFWYSLHILCMNESEYGAFHGLIQCHVKYQNVG